jgi:polysaccharide biosynthesis PFTS motif protein
MRGFRRLKKSNRLHVINNLHRELALLNLDIDSKKFNSTIMGAGMHSPEIILRQYLLARIGYTNFISSLLYASGNKNCRILFPLTKKWIMKLEREGFAVNNFGCSILWQIYLWIMFFYGVTEIFKVIIKSVISKIISIEHSRITPTCKYTYFSDLTEGNLPNLDGNTKRYGIVSWYINWNGKHAGIKSIRHSVFGIESFKLGKILVDFQDSPIPNFSKWYSIIKYTMWACAAILIALFDLTRGRWWHAFILNQAALSGKARLVPRKNLACEYMFHNSSWFCRPLWTYDVASSGSEVTLYFYSTNCEHFLTSKKYGPIFFGYQSMTWRKYLVWDIYQKDFIQRAVGSDVRIEIVGPIDFNAGLTSLPKVDKPLVAVFDMTAYRSSRYCLLVPENDFHTPTFVNKFLEDIHNSLSKFTLLMAYKPKRDIGKRSHPLYRKMVNSIDQFNNVIKVDPRTSASYLIESSCAVISSPYTSTAIIAKEMGKPSIYYDPSKTLRRGDRAAHGVPVIQSRDELELWFRSLVPS